MALSFPLSFPLTGADKLTFPLSAVARAFSYSNGGADFGGSTLPLYITGGAPSFRLPLQTSIVPTWARGSYTPTFTRASTAYQTDFELKQNLVLSGEARMQGARRVANLISSDLGTWTLGGDTTRTTGISDPDGGTNAITLTATGAAADTRIYVTAPGVTTQNTQYTFYVRRRTGSGVVEFSNSVGGIVTITSVVTTSWKRVASGNTQDGGAALSIFLRTSGDQIDLYLPMLEYTTGQSNTNPSSPVTK